MDRVMQRTTTNEDSLLVWLTQKTLQRQQHTPDVQNGAPLVLENVQANPALHVDVWVVDGSLEADLRRDIWVASGELEIEFESEAGVGSAFWADDGSSPVKEVTIVRECTDTGSGRCHERHELALETARCLLVPGQWARRMGKGKKYRLMTLPLSLEREGLAGVLEEDVTAVAMITFQTRQRNATKLNPS